ncbi:MAG: protein kinase [Deltaproteobacteria bacterium]|nr:protein kinase [Deltaproteobacteria bacterium]
MFCPVCRSEYPSDWKRCPKDEAALLRDSVIGKYRIDEVVGQGGMGAVYRAFNPDTQSPVAIKLMLAQAASNDAARARFQREAAAIAALRTRHVVTIFDFGAEPDGTLYLVMELLVGHTLRAEIDRPPAAMPLPRVQTIMDGALRGLGAAHRAGITHRDLKPENVFIAETDDGEVTKLLDFGIARVATKDAALTQSGALMGTPAYMAPEQVAGNRGQIGPWTDVYSMGVILYEALSGASPFAAETVTEVLGKVLGRQFEPLEKVRPGLPAAIYQVVDRAMSDEPEQRFAHADAMRDAWTIAHGGVPTGSDAPRGQLRRVDAVAKTEASSPAIVPVAATLPAGQAVSTAAAATADPITRTAPRGRGLLIGGALAVVAGGAAIVIATRGGGAPTIDAGAPVVAATTSDAPIAIPIDATVSDAAVPDAVALDAPPLDPALVRIDGATFAMGSDPALAKRAPDALPRHQVTVAAFAIDRREVTLALARSVLGPGVGGGTGDADDLPARNITAPQAEQVCAARGLRLPTEAEWELAARSAPLAEGRLRTAGPRANAPDPVGTHPKDCTPSGICDLLGNVMEWTADPWQQPSPKPDRRVVRGGSFRVAAADRFYASVDARTPAPPATPDPEVGFRCAGDLSP